MSSINRRALSLIAVGAWLFGAFVGFIGGRQSLRFPAPAKPNVPAIEPAPPDGELYRIGDERVRLQPRQNGNTMQASPAQEQRPTAESSPLYRINLLRELKQSKAIVVRVPPI